MPSRPQSHISLKPGLKQHTVGLDKAIPPAETVRRIKDLFQGIELNLVQDIVRIDRGRLNIPVYVCRAGKDCNIASPKTMGKGPTAEQSEASALMELVERFSHANFPKPGCYQWGTIRDISGDTLVQDHFFHLPDGQAVPSAENLSEFAVLPFAWVPAYSLSQRKDVFIPHEWFADIQGTTGLSAGNTLEETILQGVCEVVERHVGSVVNMARKPVPTIDLATVRDPIAQELVAKFCRNGIAIVCKDFSLDTGIPTVAGIAFDPATFPNSEVVYCAGTAAHPEKALIRTLTEIQQMAVDYFKEDYYGGGILPKFNNWKDADYLFDDRESVPIQSLPDVSSGDLLEEIQNCTAALGRIGLEPLVVNISHPVLQVPAVFVVIPGAQQYETALYQLNPFYYIGRRWEFMGDVETAIHRFQLSMERYPASALHCWIEIGNCLKHMQLWEEAVKAYTEALRHRPDRVMGYRIMHALNVCTEHRKGTLGQHRSPESI